MYGDNHATKTHQKSDFDNEIHHPSKALKDSGTKAAQANLLGAKIKYTRNAHGSGHILSTTAVDHPSSAINKK